MFEFSSPEETHRGVLWAGLIDLLSTLEKGGLTDSPGVPVYTSSEDPAEIRSQERIGGAGCGELLWIKWWEPGTSALVTDRSSQVAGQYWGRPRGWSLELINWLDRALHPLR